jgi:Na+-translocating ferredoxin:NAD+ oxidoreductase RnfD subunit
MNVTKRIIVLPDFVLVPSLVGLIASLVFWVSFAIVLFAMSAVLCGYLSFLTHRHLKRERARLLDDGDSTGFH